MLSTPLRAAANVLKAPFYPVYALARRRASTDGWLHLELRPRLTEFSSALPSLARFVPELAQRQPTPLAALRRLAIAAAKDPHVRGVLVELPPLQAGWSRARGLRDVFRTLRDGGKQVVVYLPRGGGNLELYVAAGASKILLGPEATFMALGLSMESRYIKTMLGKLGVSVESFARKEFKTAAETATRDSMSDPQREQLGALLAGLHGDLVDALLGRPGMTPERVAAVFEAGFLRGERAIEAGVCDGVAYEDQLGEVLAGLYPDHPRAPAPKTKGKKKRTPSGPSVVLRGAGDFLDHAEAEFFLPLRSRPYVGVVRVQGAIRDNDEEPRGIRQTFWALRAAREDDLCAGVVLLINSPGGSALASDRIHREVVRLKQEKPVVAYFEDVADSGATTSRRWPTPSWHSPSPSPAASGWSRRACWRATCWTRWACTPRCCARRPTPTCSARRASWTRASARSWTPSWTPSTRTSCGWSPKGVTSRWTSSSHWHADASGPGGRLPSAAWWTAWAGSRWRSRRCAPAHRCRSPTARASSPWSCRCAPCWSMAPSAG
ncbi:MAG: S49 family peptidase [Sandaracinaceae bacterium]|nr:S49 family peptidase [Sandaracinaceae bacterium]